MSELFSLKSDAIFESGFRPLLASDISGDLANIKYPVLLSKKLDGIRCMVYDGTAFTRSLKPIPNRHIRETLEKFWKYGFVIDGELIVGSTFQETSSAVMSYDGAPEFQYNVFDLVDLRNPIMPFEERLRSLVNMLSNITMPCTFPLPHHEVISFESLMHHHLGYVSAGNEGTMIRSLRGKYKYGRSTVNEGILLKLKTHCDSEAEIIGVEERMTNENEAERNALGYQERSTHKSGMVPAGDMGAFSCRGLEKPFKGVEFSVGTGFTSSQRENFWMNRKEMIGRIVKFRYQDFGVKDKPRMPVFLGFRDRRDL